MIVLTTKKAEESKNKVSGMNLSMKAHEDIAEVMRLMDSKEMEIPGVKNTKKGMFEFAAYHLLQKTRKMLGVVVDENADNE
jgi:hypothetical protein